MAEVTANGVRLHVQRLGTEGPPVVFLHGLVMDNLSSWFFTVANPMAQQARVWLYDLRGHGRSERPERGYGVEAHVADLAELLDAEGVHEPVHLVGNSFGGLLALAFTLEHPQRVASLALVDPIPPVPGWSQAMNDTLGLTGEARDQQIATSFQHWLGRHSGRKRNRLAQTAQALVEGTTLLPDLAEHPGLSDAAMLRLPQPALLILGEHSDMRDAGHRLAASLSHATVDVIDDATHSVIWEHTATVRDRILAWVEQHS